MSRAAKDAYNTYHEAMANWDAPAFEYLTMREMEAWRCVAGVVQDQLDRFEYVLQEERREIRHLEAAADDLREELHRSENVIDDLKDRLKAAQATKEETAK